MTVTFETSQTAKALKVIAAAQQLKSEGRGPRGLAAGVYAATLSGIVTLPMESLARLHDLILEHDTPADAAAALERA